MSRKPLRKIHIEDDDSPAMVAPLPGKSSAHARRRDLVVAEMKSRPRVQTEDQKSSAVKLLNEIAWYIYEMDSDGTADGHVLVSLLTNSSDLDRIADHFDGAVIRTPQKKERRDSRMLSIVFYLYEIQKKSWSQIKEILKDNPSFKNYNLISLRKRAIKIRKSLETNKRQMWDRVAKLDLEAVLAAIYEQKI